MTGPNTGRPRAPHRREAADLDREIEVERLRAELAEERARRIAAEDALAEQREQTLDEALRASRLRDLSGITSVPTPQLRIQRRTPLRGNWLQ
jgi:hypothetical protein